MSLEAQSLGLRSALLKLLKGETQFFKLCRLQFVLCRLVDRVNTSTLLEDRRDACRALKAMSRKFRLEVGAQGLV